MSILEWLGRQIESQPFLWSADDMVWPIDHLLDGQADTREPEPAPAQGRTDDPEGAPLQ